MQKKSWSVIVGCAAGAAALVVGVASLTGGTARAAEGRPLPAKPLPGQEVPPCPARPGLKVEEINGGCWVQLEPPPEGRACSAHAVVHRGRCYAPVAKGPPPS